MAEERVQRRLAATPAAKSALPEVEQIGVAGCVATLTRCARRGPFAPRPRLRFGPDEPICTHGMGQFQGPLELLLF